MNAANVIVFLQGATAASATAVGVLFFRFWRSSGDRLFAGFAAAFWMLALSWTLLGVFSPTEEARPYVYGLRLVAFLCIIMAIVDKNRSRR
jgi:hypothetical protein